MYKRKLLLVSAVLFFIVSGVYAQFGDSDPKSIDEFDGRIHIPTMSLRYSTVDIAVPSRGPAFEFIRYYNNRHDLDPEMPSLDTQIGGYGYDCGCRWGYSYGWELRNEGDIYVDGSEYISVRTGSGGTQMFCKHSGEQDYEPEPGVRARLELLGANPWHWVYIDKHGTRYYLKAVGINNSKVWLVKIEDRNGNYSEVIYETGSSSRRIKAVIDPVGRIAKFYYEHSVVSSLLTKIEFGIGTADALSEVYETVLYGYNDSANY